MEREYDLFEQFANGEVLWRMTVTGHENAIQKLSELSATTYNEVRVIHLPSQAVVAVMNRRDAADYSHRESGIGGGIAVPSHQLRSQLHGQDAGCR